MHITWSLTSDRTEKTLLLWLRHLQQDHLESIKSVELTFPRGIVKPKLQQAREELTYLLPEADIQVLYSEEHAYGIFSKFLLSRNSEV